MFLVTKVDLFQGNLRFFVFFMIFMIFWPRHMATRINFHIFHDFWIFDDLVGRFLEQNVKKKKNLKKISKSHIFLSWSENFLISKSQNFLELKKSQNVKIWKNHVFLIKNIDKLIRVLICRGAKTRVGCRKKKSEKNLKKSYFGELIQKKKKIANLKPFWLPEISKRKLRFFFRGGLVLLKKWNFLYRLQEINSK